MSDIVLNDPPARTAPAPAPSAAPPTDLIDILAQAVAVYAAAQAGGKDWWRSKAMWGAVVSIAGSVGAVVALACKVDPAVVASCVAALSAIGGALAGVGRASATGPIR